MSQNDLDRQLHASDYGQEMKEREVIEEKIKKEFRYAGSIRHVNGWTLFEINQVTWEIKPAEFREACAVHFSGKEIPKKVDMKQGCFYLEALNYKWAMVKYLRLCKIEKPEEQISVIVRAGLDPKKVLPKEFYKKGMKKK